MKLKQVIAIFFCVLIFTSNSLVQACRDFIVTKDMFDLEIIEKKKSLVTPASPKYGIILQAFDFNYLDEYELKMKQSMINSYIKAVDAAGEKIDLNGLLNYLNSIMGNYGHEETLTGLFNELKNIDSSGFMPNKLSLQLKDIELKLNKTLNKGNKGFDYTVLGTSMVLSSLVTNGITSFFNPIAAPSLIFYTLTTTAVSIFSFFWNRSCDKEIKQNEKKIRKFKNLIDIIYLKVKNLDWIGKNVILTGMAEDDDCHEVAVLFEYDDNIKNENWTLTERKMARRTCLLKKEECPDTKSCINNIMNISKCLGKQKKGKMERCPYFDELDCSLIFDDYESDL